MVAQTNPTTTGAFSGFLNPEQAQPYFDEVRKRSVVQQVARQIPLGVNGAEIPVSTSKPEAGWVSEGGRKPATEAGLALRSIQPKKLATISVVSAEVVRSNPGDFMDILKEDIAESFAVAFDNAVLHGVSTPFGGFVDDAATKVELGDVFFDIANNIRHVKAFVWDQRAEPILLGATDTTGRPLFTETPFAESTAATPGRLLGRPSFVGDNIFDDAEKIVGYGGPWENILWGVLGGISYRVSSAAAVTIGGQLVSLFEHNLVALLAEAEYGCVIHEPEKFVAFTAVGGGSGYSFNVATTFSLNVGESQTIQVFDPDGLGVSHQCSLSTSNAAVASVAGMTVTPDAPVKKAAPRKRAPRKKAGQ